MSEEIGSRAEVVVEYEGNYKLRISAATPQQAAATFEAVVSKVQDAHREEDRRRMRRAYFGFAHVFVFATATLALAGMIAHFLNYWEFNTGILTTLGVWIVGTIAYLYFIVIKDVFGIKARIRPPLGGGAGDGA